MSRSLPIFAPKAEHGSMYDAGGGRVAFIYTDYPRKIQYATFILPKVEGPAKGDFDVERLIRVFLQLVIFRYDHLEK